MPPQTLLETPLWLLEALIDNLERLQAEEQQIATTVVLLPYVKQNERMRVLRRLGRATARQAEREDVRIVEENPDKARAYFAALGAKVIDGG